MADSFKTLIPTLSDARLQDYLRNYSKYKLEAVEAAAEELRRRGHAVPEEQLAEIRARLSANGLPVTSGQARTANRRIRRLAASILGAGFVAGLAIYVRAALVPEEALAYDAMNSKKYLRELELYGGKANVLATEFRMWFDGLWQGRNLAFTVFCMAALAALLVWLAGTRRAAADTQNQ